MSTSAGHTLTRSMPALFELMFVNQTFRDVADQDYIAARTLFRTGLDLQFLWAGLQAVEKYLKGILLYNAVDTRGLGHRLTAAYKRVSEISGIRFDFPPDLAPLIEHLEVYGQNRYLQYPHFTHGEELLQLDRTVWYLRRYCQYLRHTFTNASGESVSVLPAEIKRLQGQNVVRHPTRFRILGGYLERVLTDEGSALRASLIWKNEYFGSPRRRKIRSFWTRSVSVNPVHFMEPQVIEVLRQRGDFPKAVIKYFDRMDEND